MESGAFSTETVTTSALGERIIVDGEGNRTIAPTQRPDGSYRKEIRIRPGFFRQEEQAKFVSKGAEFRQREVAAHASNRPIGYAPSDDRPVQPSEKSKKKRKPKKHNPVDDLPTEMAKVEVEAFVLPCIQRNEAKPLTLPTSPVPEVEKTEPSNSTTQNLSSPLPANRLKTVQRTLKEIELLEKKQRQGQGLAPAQIKKIGRKKDLECELLCLIELLESFSLKDSNTVEI